MVIAAIGLLILLPRSREQSLRLPDGSVITFKGAEFGTNHTYPPNGRFLRKIRRYLPLQLRRKFLFSGGYAIGEASVFFWYLQSVASNPPLRLQKVVVDDNGVESAVIFYECGQPQPDGSKLQGCGATVWPRRSRRLGLRFYQDDGTNPWVRLGEFWMDNPRRTNPAQWEPQPLPVSASAGDLQVTLVGWQYGRLPAGSGETPPDTSRDWPYLRLRVAVKGKPSTAWQVGHTSLEDAGGNKLGTGGSYTAGEEEILPILGRLQERAQTRIQPLSLWPGERAWRIGLTLSPRPNAIFNPEELRVVGDLPVPGPGAFVALNTTNTVPGGAFVLEGLYGKGLDPSGAEGRFPDSVVLTLTPRMARDCSFKIVKVVDESGAEIRFAPAQGFMRPAGPATFRGFLGVALSVPPESKSLAITFAVATNRVVTFLAPAPEFPSGSSKR